MNAATIMGRLGCLCMLASLPAAASVRLPAMLSDHAVLQRDAPIHVWGWADVDERVQVHFHAQLHATTADELGKWEVWLQPEPAGGPYVLTVTGSNTLTRSDILVGDVWFASGQSNMELPLKGFGSSGDVKNGASEIAHSSNPNLRLLRFNRKSSMFPLRDQDAAWTPCVPETAAEFSAGAYFFGREIAGKEHVPVGLIDSTWGGTPAVAWTSLDAISADASLMPEFADRARTMDEQDEATAMVARDKRQDEADRAAGRPTHPHAWHPQPEMYAPAGLYNGMVAPATDYSIKGVIWYQGETDSFYTRAATYERIFPAMITDWRTHWHQGEFPFLFVQISSFTSTPEEYWGIARESQRRTLKLANTGMAVTTDVGEANNVHPADKQTVGARLALAARAIAYGEHIEFSGPIFRQATSEGASMRVWFTHGAGLTARGAALATFEVAGSDHRFKAAAGKIDGETVVLTSSEVMHPVYVRYAWANAPVTANLYNGAGLPASTFTSEERIPPPCPGNCTQ